MVNLSEADVPDMIRDTAKALPSWLRNPLPTWLRDGLATEPEDGQLFRRRLRVLNRRRNARHTWTVLARATLLGGTASKQFFVKTFDVSLDGIGLITRVPLRVSANLELFPVDGPGDPVRVRVTYCIQTIQGYKVGCELITG